MSGAPCTLHETQQEIARLHILMHNLRIARVQIPEAFGSLHDRISRLRQRPVEPRRTLLDEVGEGAIAHIWQDQKGNLTPLVSSIAIIQDGQDMLMMQAAGNRYLTLKAFARFAVTLL